MSHSNVCSGSSNDLAALTGACSSDAVLVADATAGVYQLVAFGCGLSTVIPYAWPWDCDIEYLIVQQPVLSLRVSKWSMKISS